MLATGSPLHIPAGTLGPAIVTLGTQAGISIGLADQDLARYRTPAIDGRLTPANALRKLLRKVPARVIAIDGVTFRIVREPRHERTPQQPAPASVTVSSRDAMDIVVTASKRRTRLTEYPGMATVLGSDALNGSAPGGSDAILSRVPSLSSTQLGPGRNKLFIGGVADSSFNGPTQATVGQYLGELRLTYNAPDPDLALYDVDSVEVLEGPQGTLYGAGSLGGIIRIQPKPVRLDAIEGMAIAGLGATAHGENSTDIAAMLNLPLIADRVGVRMLGYRKIDGGYIDDLERGKPDINRTRTVGGRATVDARLGAWSIAATASFQNIDSKDGQYAERGLPPLSKRDAIAQPFDNDYSLGGVVVRRSLGATDFVSATGFVRQTVDARYDFTPEGDPPRLFDQQNDITLVSNETRLSRRRPDGAGWLIGTSFLFDTESLTRTLGGTRITGVRNDVTEGALYGELTLPILPRLLATAGGRISYDHLSGQGLDLDDEAEASTDVSSNQLRVLPSIALAWRPDPGLLLFARYEEGFRPGGLSVAGEASNAAVERFRGDSVGTIAGGVRIERRRWSLSATLSMTSWKNIQADLIDVAGLPFTANLGGGDIRSAELRLDWRPIAGVSLDAAIGANDSELNRPVPAFAQARDSTLPNIPELSARAGFAWEHALTAALRLNLSGWLRYVGRSRLGVGPVLDIGQGGYVDDGLTARIGTGRYGLTLSARNLSDMRGNRFALGNPFTVDRRDQVTPLRPRTIRIGFDGRF